jgi:hypothetical protein
MIKPPLNFDFNVVKKDFDSVLQAALLDPKEWKLVKSKFYFMYFFEKY